MHIITKKRIIQAADQHKSCNTALLGWYKVMKDAELRDFAELKALFNSVDKVGNVFVFNIGGNKLRLVAAIHFNTQKVFIRAILTHKEYDKDKWKV